MSARTWAKLTLGVLVIGGIVATGSFGDRRFVHRAVRGGCPEEDGWLAVNALASPVLEPDQTLEEAGGGSTSP